MAKRQGAQMSKITNEGLTRSGTGCFIAVPIWQQWTSQGQLSISKRDAIQVLVKVHDIFVAISLSTDRVKDQPVCG